MSIVDYQNNIDYLTDKNIKVITINWGENANTIKKWLNKNKITFDTILDKRGTTQSSWGFKTIPLVVLVNPEGKVLIKTVVYNGFEGFKVELEKALAADAS